MDDWKTPKELYDKLNIEFNFNFDPCPLNSTFDGLSIDWGSKTFLNPPYSNPLPWCKKSVDEMNKGKLVVGLLRSDTSTEWFHNYVLPFAEIRFIKGRLRFNNNGRAPFASIIAIWNPLTKGV